MFFAGAFFSVLSTYMPHSPNGDTQGLRYLALAELLSGIVVLFVPRGWRRFIPGAVVLGAVVVVSISVTLNGEKLGDPPTMTEFFYAWPAVYVGYYFPRWAVPAFIGTVGLGYALALSAMSLDGNVGIRWGLTVSIVAGLTVSAHAIRTHVNGLVDRLHSTARTDTLTSMPNRRAFDERLCLELERADRTAEPLALLIGDIDHFKLLNDSFGHAAGDAALASVGRVLMSECRAIDTPARIGGEEFAVLLPATDGHAALATADRLRAAVSRIHDTDDRPLTISFGIAEHPGAGTNASDLMAAADRALYAAKKAGPRPRRAARAGRAHPRGLVPDRPRLRRVGRQVGVPHPARRRLRTLVLVHPLERLPDARVAAGELRDQLVRAVDQSLNLRVGRVLHAVDGKPSRRVRFKGVPLGRAHSAVRLRSAWKWVGRRVSGALCRVLGP